MLAARFAAPVGLLWVAAFAALLAAGASALYIVASLAALPASLAAVYLISARIARAIAVPADAIATAMPQDNRFVIPRPQAPSLVRPLPELEFEFATLGTALMSRLSRDAQLASELARAKEDAQSANVAKSQFLSDMSHQLRTPLNAIIGYATLLQEDAINESRQEEMEDLDRILHASRTLLELINYVIDLSRIETGKTSLQRGILDINSVASSIVSSFDLPQQGNGNTLKVNISPRDRDHGRRRLQDSPVPDQPGRQRAEVHPRRRGRAENRPGPSVAASK